MRSELNNMDIIGQIVIGEGELDEASCYISEKNLVLKMVPN